MATQSQPIVGDHAYQSVKDLSAYPPVKAALDQAEQQQPQRIKEQVALTETEAPPFHEDDRREVFEKMLKDTGIKDVKIDKIGNVIGRYKGEGDGPTLVIAAHLDTVFPAGTNVKVKQEGTVYRAPGISDDAAGLASMLQVVRCLTEQKIPTIGDIVFAATLGEEGNGDLRGCKALFEDANDYDGMLAIDSASPTRLTKGGVGCTRWRITFNGPGGHSLHKFGLVGNAIHGLSRLITKIDEVEAPKEPRSTFNVGVIKGGTSVNAIPEQASMELDIRSYKQDSLKTLTDKLLSLVDEALKEENERWGLEDSGKLTAEVTQIGDRPAGANEDDSPVLQAAFASMYKLGIPLLKYNFAATDQNVPLAKGLPATTLGAGGSEDNNHSVKEWGDSKEAYLGPQLTLLTALVLVGVKGVNQPLLPKLDH